MVDVKFLEEVYKVLLLLIITVLALIWLIFKRLEYRKLPSGPFGLPLVGYFPFLSKDPHLVYMKLNKKYGDIFSLNLCQRLYVVINDIDSAKQMLCNPATYARPNEIEEILIGKGGIIFYEGNKWLEQRKVCISIMRTLGVGKGEWESLIQEAASELRDEIKSLEGKPTDFLKLLEISQASNMTSLLIGRRLLNDIGNKDFQILMNFVTRILPQFTTTNFAAHLPVFLLKLLIRLPFLGTDKLLQGLKDLEEFFKREIEKNKHLNSENFISCYLEELQKKQRSNEEHYFSIDHLLGNMTALFFAGFDTTKTSIHWLLLIVASQPVVQQKVQQEIDAVGRNRKICWEDRKLLPYTMATIHEMQRWVVITPLFPPRRAREPIKISDYVYPKGCNFLVNNWNLMRNQKFFENPDDFKPERFLESDNGQFKKLDNYMPFSIGKRNCPGEHVAMMTIFLYFMTIMQKFRLTCPSGKSVNLESMVSDPIRKAFPQELCFIEISE